MQNISISRSKHSIQFWPLDNNKRLYHFPFNLSATRSFVSFSAAFINDSSVGTRSIVPSLWLYLLWNLSTAHSTFLSSVRTSWAIILLWSSPFRRYTPIVMGRCVTFSGEEGDVVDADRRLLLSFRRMAEYHARILELMNVRRSAKCGLIEHGQSNMFKTWVTALALFLRTQSTLGEAVGLEEGGSKVHEADGACKLCSVKKARFVQSWWWPTMLLVDTVRQGNAVAEAAAVFWLIISMYDCRSLSQSSIWSWVDGNDVWSIQCFDMEWPEGSKSNWPFEMSPDGKVIPHRIGAPSPRSGEGWSISKAKFGERAIVWSENIPSEARISEGEIAGSRS